ncbi:hypothetical protein NC653_003701 [Populus alba x Populus x berolinensis]|uniref:Cytochrome b6-f complex subunit 6 n=1 Tax=Populus alba x Populus x berolinensis TaxID=444605 RepID=A0AAD6WJ34_9ROSI|nr:hypothetical protein NC653_003701 [Populus alba x Populus x berolinensis]
MPSITSYFGFLFIALTITLILFISKKRYNLFKIN